MEATEHGKPMFFMPFLFREHATPETQASAVFAIRLRTDQTPGGSFMLNLRVRNLNALVDKLKAAEVAVEVLEQHEGQGCFAYLREADGNQVGVGCISESCPSFYSCEEHL